MPQQDSVSQWIGGLRDGDQEAARRLWERYFHKLAHLVRRKLPDHARRAADEEGVALSAFKSFCAGVAEDRFPQLDGRDNLWAVLVVIGSRKAHSYLESHGRLKRGGGEVRGESVFLSANSGSGPIGLDGLADEEPTPAFAAEVAEQCQVLLDALADDTLRNIALLKMQGHTIDEIAERIGSTKRAVQRRLEIIRRTWRDADPSAEGEPVIEEKTNS